MSTDLWKHARFSVAPMMAWTDRHCRMFHRLISAHALLYTEMVTAAALVHGDAAALLEHSPDEHPVALQIGGSDPQLLAKASQIGERHGYPEINLNVGCPSDRVQSGAFGAVLMKSPDVVAASVCAMQDAVQSAEITVKCRIGVDDQNPKEVLPAFLQSVRATGVRRVTIHARMAWLQGLSPKENRDVPPLDYDLVHAMKAEFPDLHISINGGLQETETAIEQIHDGLDGVMVGRAAYQTPFQALSPVDEVYFGVPGRPCAIEVARKMGEYIDGHIQKGGKMHHVTRHMLGLFAGQPGARQWRRTLSHLGADTNATRASYEAAVDAVEQSIQSSSNMAA